MLLYDKRKKRNKETKKQRNIERQTEIKADVIKESCSFGSTNDFCAFEIHQQGISSL